MTISFEEREKNIRLCARYWRAISKDDVLKRHLDDFERTACEADLIHMKVLGDKVTVTIEDNTATMFCINGRILD